MFKPSSTSKPEKESKLSDVNNITQLMNKMVYRRFLSTNQLFVFVITH